MSALADTLLPNGGRVADAATSARRRPSAVVDAPSVARKQEHLLSAILTTSACLHLLVVGYLGFGVPADIPRLHIARAAASAPPIIENIQLEAAPPPKIAREISREQPPPAAPDIPVSVTPIAAVPSSVNVAFAMRVVGPVRLVSDASEASGGRLAAAPDIPQEVGGRSLLTPPLSYPADALYRHLTGKVVVEFHTTATGDIVDVRVRSSSGYETLDRAALENIRLGRWVGEAGYFTKTYEFVLR